MTPDPFMARLQSRSTRDERARAQADVEFYQAMARTSSPWRDVLVIVGVTAFAVTGIYLTALKPYIEGRTGR